MFFFSNLQKDLQTNGVSLESDNSETSVIYLVGLSVGDNDYFVSTIITPGSSLHLIRRVRDMLKTTGCGGEDRHQVICRLSIYFYREENSNFLFSVSRESVGAKELWPGRRNIV